LQREREKDIAAALTATSTGAFSLARARLFLVFLFLLLLPQSGQWLGALRVRCRSQQREDKKRSSPSQDSVAAALIHFSTRLTCPFLRTLSRLFSARWVELKFIEDPPRVTLIKFATWNKSYGPRMRACLVGFSRSMEILLALMLSGSFELCIAVFCLLPRKVLVYKLLRRHGKIDI
jgi:hypothetical protein